MDLNKILLIILIAILFSSCNKNAKKLNHFIVENEKIKIEMYEISQITSIHQFIDLTNKQLDSKEMIFEGNSNTVDSIFIKHDTIILIIKTKKPIIYNLSAIKYGYNIKYRDSNKEK